jgi:hypothetical protein
MHENATQQRQYQDQLEVDAGGCKVLERLDER